MRVVQMRGNIPEILSSGKIAFTAQTINALITKLNSPNVIILNGRVISFSTGLMKKLISPSTHPARSSVFISPLNVTPEINLSASQNPAMPATI